MRVEFGQSSRQPVVFAQQQRVQRGQSDVLVCSIVAYRSKGQIATPVRLLCVAVVNVTTRLTRQETGHLSGIAVVRYATSGGAQVGVHGGEGQELTAVVVVLGVHLQQALIGGEVSEKAGLDIVCAVHLTHIDEGCEGVHLLPHVALTEHVTRVARTASWR